MDSLGVLRWVCWVAILVNGFRLPAGTNLVPPFSIGSPRLQNGAFYAHINSATGCVYTLQISDSAQGYWTEGTTQVGSGGVLSFADTNGTSARFYRIAGIPSEGVRLFPSIPLLSSGAVSLLDATVGAGYTNTISPGPTGTGPYLLSVSNSPPSGISVLVVSNNTPNALARVTSTGINLVAGQRTQFSVSVTDGAGTSLSRVYDLRVIAPPPQIQSTQVVLKAGATTNLVLPLINGSPPFRWSHVSGPLPAGVTFSASGSLGGTPTADALELNQTGLYTNLFQVADSFTDRVTGIAQPRLSTQTITELVRLSYRLNLQPFRLGSPNFQGICLACHGPGFHPDFSAPTATSIIRVNAGSGGDCSPSYYFIVPKDLADSLIYLKVTGPACGNRMPDGGPYLDQTQMNRIARWILELGFTDTD